ncbi:S-adenosyl-L-methionine-dependent methyltransferase [Trichoderma austrokoningii]
MADTARDLIQKLDAAAAINFDDDDATRLELVMAARKLYHRLETNAEKILRFMNEEPVVYPAIQILIDTGVWDAWTAGGGGEKHSDELRAIAKKDIDPELLQHLLQLLASSNMIEETGEGLFLPTKFSLALGDKSTLVAPALRVRTDHVMRPSIHFPEFLAKTDYRMPSDDTNSCYINTYPEKMDYFGRCKANPSLQQSFSSFLAIWSQHRRPWPQFYDTQALIEGSDLSNGSALVVDIGGHHGADLYHLLEKHPDIPAGSLVLQDLPKVIASANLTTDKIKAMGHNFFEPQPVKGSRVYYFHAVLHDWPDKTVVEILKQVAAAMKPGYSKLLINDIVLPPVGASVYQTGLDCFMLQISGKERTEAVWNKVIGEAGMKIVNIWPDGRGYESLVEAELL